MTKIPERDFARCSYCGQYYYFFNKAWTSFDIHNVKWIDRTTTNKKKLCYNRGLNCVFEA